MSGPRGISLHIGVNFVDKSHYGGEWDGKLDWAEKDSDDILNIADKQGFETLSLKSQEATREMVMSAIGDIAKDLKAGDFFLLSYSGHGGTIPDVDGDEDDLVDETWCLFNGQLLDDELSILWSAFQPGVRILVLSDSCHSGTLLKSIDENSIQLQQAGKTVDPDEVFEHARAMPRDVAKSTARSNRGFYAELQYALPDPRPAIHATVRLISGCQEHEQSFEGGANGRFTDAVKRTYADGKFKGDYHAFHLAVRELVKEKQTPNHVVRGQPNEAFDKERPFKI